MIVPVAPGRVVGLSILVLVIPMIVPMIVTTRRMMLIRAILRTRERGDQPAHGERREGKQCRLQKVHGVILQGQIVKFHFRSGSRQATIPGRSRLMSVLAYAPGAKL